MSFVFVICTVITYLVVVCRYFSFTVLILSKKKKPKKKEEYLLLFFHFCKFIDIRFLNVDIIFEILTYRKLLSFTPYDWSLPSCQCLKVLFAIIITVVVEKRVITFVFILFLYTKRWMGCIFFSLFAFFLLRASFNTMFERKLAVF